MCIIFMIATLQDVIDMASIYLYQSFDKATGMECFI